MKFYWEYIFDELQEVFETLWHMIDTYKYLLTFGYDLCSCVFQGFWSPEVDVDTGKREIQFPEELRK